MPSIIVIPYQNIQNAGQIDYNKTQVLKQSLDYFLYLQFNVNHNII